MSRLLRKIGWRSSDIMRSLLAVRNGVPQRASAGQDGLGLLLAGPVGGCLDLVPAGFHSAPLAAHATGAVEVDAGALGVVAFLEQRYVRPAQQLHGLPSDAGKGRFRGCDGPPPG